MAFTPPTAATLKASYPEFAAVTDAAVNAALAEAGTAVDDGWDADVAPIAYGLYAAHVLVLDGLGTSAQAQGIASSGGNLKKRQAGDTSEEFFGPGGGSGGASASWYAATPYGARFRRLQRRQFAGPRVY